MTQEYRLQDVKPITVLRETFGEEVLLDDEGSEGSVPYRILAEFALGDRKYAVLQSDDQKREGDVSLYRVADAGGGGPELETILDDDEWENVAELYDEMTFTFDDEM